MGSFVGESNSLEPPPLLLLRLPLITMSSASTPVADTFPPLRRSARLEQKAKRTECHCPTPLATEEQKHDEEPVDHCAVLLTRLSVSATTEPPQDVNKDGIPYAFLSKNEYVLPHIYKLIQQSKESTTSEDNTKHAKELFEFLLYQPVVLVYTPAIRNVVRKKIAEFRTVLQSRASNTNCTHYESLIQELSLNAVNVRHTGIRNRIVEKVKEMEVLLAEYRVWAESTEFLTIMDKLEQTLDALVAFPGYVA